MFFTVEATELKREKKFKKMPFWKRILAFFIDMMIVLFLNTLQTSIRTPQLSYWDFLQNQNRRYVLLYVQGFSRH